MAKATVHKLDMTDVKDGGQFNPKHQREGDYRAQITDVADAKPKKKDGEKQDKTPMWVFTIKVGTGTYPYYCKLQDNQLWKVRNLAIAAGMSVPKKKLNLDPNKLVGKSIAVTLEDDEYEGKLKSVISATFPLSELDADDDEDDDEDDEDEDEDEDDDDDSDDDDDDEDEDEDDDDEEEEEEEVKPKKKAKTKTKAASKSKKGKKSKKADDDEDLDDIDIDDV